MVFSHDSTEPCQFDAEIVSPLALVMKVKKATNQKNENITFNKITNKIKIDQIKVHKHYSPQNNEESDDDILIKLAFSEGHDQVKQIEQKKLSKPLLRCTIKLMQK